MLTTCDKRDGQTFAGEVQLHRLTLCMSESHNSLKGERIFDVIASEAGGGWVADASRAAGHGSLDMHLNSPHAAAASLVYSSARQE